MKTKLLDRAGPLAALIGALAIALAAPADAPLCLDLPGAIALAVRQSPEVGAVAARADEMEGQMKEVQAKFMPQISFEASYLYIDNPPKIELDLPLPLPVKPSIPMGYRDNYSAQLKLNQVFFSTQLAHAYRAMEEQARSGRLQIDQARLTVARLTAEAYLGVAISENALDAREDSLRRACAHLDQTRTRYELGTAAGMEVERWEIERSQAEQRVAETRRLSSQARSMLERALGQKLGEAKIDCSLSVPLECPDLPAALARAAANRPDLKALTAGREAALLVAKAADAQRMPQVGLTASFGYQKPYYVVDDWDQNLTVGLGVKLPLYDGGAADAGVQRAEATARSLAEQRRSVEAATQAELESAAAAMDDAIERARLTAETLLHVERLIQIAEDSYQIGAVTTLEVIDAENALESASLANLMAWYDYRVARVRYFAAQGDVEAIGR